ncbi:hypothetical protein GOP47_0022198 [Adiantum capillus-veneris]|uniref:Dirigent protein n=1 Tax=Adiantum capillus-veneris TaxID=13818 RepID=A0A9D4U8W1_ADICA|nr:hypothetical protein GOP47_0022198 [Adiantum capillus-veneris]
MEEAARRIKAAALLVSMMVMMMKVVHIDVVAGMRSEWATGGRGEVLRYYLQQQYGENEFTMVQAAKPPPAGAGFAAGVGLQVVYEFVMTRDEEASSEVLGFVRGTALVVNSTAAATVFFVNNVIHWEYGGLNGTLSQQGEAVFSRPPWEFSILSGTGSFRMVRGFNVGTFVSATPSPNGTHIVTYYEARLFLP